MRITNHHLSTAYHHLTTSTINHYLPPRKDLSSSRPHVGDWDHGILACLGDPAVCEYHATFLLHMLLLLLSCYTWYISFSPATLLLLFCYSPVTHLIISCYTAATTLSLLLLSCYTAATHFATLSHLLLLLLSIYSTLILHPRPMWDILQQLSVL